MKDSRITKTKVLDFNLDTNKFYTSQQRKYIETMTDVDGRFREHIIRDKAPNDSTISSSMALALHSKALGGAPSTESLPPWRSMQETPPTITPDTSVGCFTI